ncbi:hypothetical protein SOVF_084900 [Spinacia oleracea]|nr:hypothetical protein SOVF_084900 [Spinacia oleracea]
METLCVGRFFFPREWQNRVFSMSLGETFRRYILRVWWWVDKMQDHSLGVESLF